MINKCYYVMLLFWFSCKWRYINVRFIIIYTSLFTKYTVLYCIAVLYAVKIVVMFYYEHKN